MRLRLSVVTDAAVPVDVVVAAEVGTMLEDARGGLLDAAGLPADSPLFAGGALLPGSSVLGRAPLLQGAVLSARGPRAAPPSRACRGAGVLEIHVSAGPDAGRVHRLPPGRHRLGRSPHVEVTIRDPDVSRLHANLDVGPAGVTVTDAESTNGTTVDGVPVDREPHPVAPGSALVVGSTTLVLRLPVARGAATTPGDDGTLRVNRAPRHALARGVRQLRAPQEPVRPEPAAVPVLGIVVPLVVSIPMALLWSPFALLLGLTTPVMVLVNAFSERRSGQRRHRRAVAEHRAALERLEETLTAELAAETLWRRDRAPDAAALTTVAGTPTTRLWERRPGDDDALLLRVATGDLPAMSVRLDPPAGPGGPASIDPPAGIDTASPRWVTGVPVTVDLRRVGVVGVSGPRASVLGLARFLVAQVATLHSPRDVRLVVLAARQDDEPGAARSDWGWVRWLPHADPADRAGGGVPAGADDVGRCVRGLVELVHRREELSGAPGSQHAGPGVVVVLDGAQRLRRDPGVAALLRHGPASSVYVLCLDDAAGQLPAECAGTLQLGGETGSRVTLGGLDDVARAEPVADMVSAAWAEQLARALAPLRDATPEDSADVVPASARLLDLLPAHLGVPSLDPVRLARRWQSAPRSTRALLGVTADGLYAPDLCHDGPHVLVGGTTGSGKSELLQTLIASLAAANRPEELSFVLVDYKGGAAFSDCARLPHTVGLVTDLDGHLTRRALTSLSAEVARRERVLSAAGARDLEHYQRLMDAGRTGTPVPRLVVVVDEFRVLAEEHPDFVTGLVRLAAVGRSLGLHLVLATQRPGGVIGPDIAANVNLRIALRVRDQVDSRDVVDAPDAASIDARTPGRAASRSGSGPLVTFQTARVGGRPPDTRQRRVVAWRDAGDTGPDLGGGTASPGLGPTDIEVLVDVLAETARRAHAARQPSPWLPPLPDEVGLDAVRARVVAPGASPTSLAVGLLDHPEAMAQRAWCRDPALDGPLLVVGTSRTGRTTTLLAFAAAAAAVPPERLHVYAIDGGGGGLASVSALPHTGAVVPRNQPDRMLRLLRRLRTEVGARRARAAPGSGRDSRPAVLLLVDAWEVVQRELEDAEHGAGLEDLLQVVREGPAVGVTAVLAGDRTLLTGRLASAVCDRLLLRTADVTDAVLAGVSRKDLPDHMPPGRGLLVGAAGVREVQVARVDAVPTTGWDAAAAGGPVGPADRAALPFRVDALPDLVTVGDLRRLVAPGTDRPATWMGVGVGGDDVRPVGLDLGEHPVAVVAGPAGSGRSTALAGIAETLCHMGFRPLLVRARPVPGCPPAAHVFTPAEAASLAAALEGGGGPRPVVLVDDADAVDGTPLEAVLLAATRGPRSGADGVLGVVLAGEPSELASRFRGVAAEARRARAGILLSPTGYADGDLLGVSVPRSGEVRPGRGYLVRRGIVVPVQVAAPDGAFGMLAP
jgi:S-DNA-T family DNA segregation ATPase FtsK/SpoIIIE